MKPLADYHPIKALRPFSLVVALIGAGLGVLLALLEGHSDLWRGALIVVAALMAQAGINLINDVEDLKTVDKLNRATRRRILSNTKIAALLFALCFATAGYFAALHGWQVWVYSLAIALLTLSYNLGPLNFKSRGLSLFHVFLLTGVLLVQGAYFAMTGQASWRVLSLSLPISFLVSALLLSNELRDWEEDTRHRISTTTVRIGFHRASQLYWLLLGGAYLSALLALAPSQLAYSCLLLIPLSLIPAIRRQLHRDSRPALTKLSGRLLLIFGLVWMGLQLIPA